MVGNLEGDWIDYRVWFEKHRILRCRLGPKTAIGSHCLQITNPDFYEIKSIMVPPFV